MRFGRLDNRTLLVDNVLKPRPGQAIESFCHCWTADLLIQFIQIKKYIYS